MSPVGLPERHRVARGDRGGLAVAAGGTAGGGKGIATMTNAKGVRITLHSTTQGLDVTAGPEGMKITLE